MAVQNSSKYLNFPRTLLKTESIDSFPFKLTGTVESGSAKIYVYPGLVNTSVPKIGGVSLINTPPPSITVTGTYGEIGIKATVDILGNISTAPIIENYSAIPEDTLFEKYQIIGYWFFDSGVFTNVSNLLNTNIALCVYNGGAIWD